MTVKELIEALEGMPPDAEAYYMSGPCAGQTLADEIPPDPQIQDDGRVCL